MNCKHCQRAIIQRQGEWIDPTATGDDRIWRYVCDSNDTLQAEHTPQGEQQ
jgi:YD repeat-containing protein